VVEAGRDSLLCSQHLWSVPRVHVWPLAPLKILSSPQVSSYSRQIWVSASPFTTGLYRPAMCDGAKAVGANRIGSGKSGCTKS